MTSQSALIGQPVEELDTPALLVDLDTMEANIRHMASFMGRHGVNWRPHTKGVKVPAIAKQELAAGAFGVTCAKLGDAEAMAAAGVDNILIANQVVGTRKIERLGRARAARHDGRGGSRESGQCAGAQCCRRGRGREHQRPRRGERRHGPLRSSAPRAGGGLCPPASRATGTHVARGDGLGGSYRAYRGPGGEKTRDRETPSGCSWRQPSSVARRGCRARS